MTTEKALALILQEVTRAENEHPYWPGDDVHGAAIVAEESGELVKAVLDAMEGKGGDQEIATEAVHTAAASIRFLKNFIGKGTV